MVQEVIESNAFEGGADVLVGVSEQQVAADLFNREVGGVADQRWGLWPLLPLSYQL